MNQDEIPTGPIPEHGSETPYSNIPTPPSIGVPEMKRLAPEPLQPWVNKTIRDTFTGFLHAPIHICIASIFPLLPSLLLPKIDFKKMFEVGANGMPDWSKWSEHLGDLSLFFVISLMATLIAYAIAFRWADRMRLERSFGIEEYLAGLASVPRILFAFLFQTVVFIGAIVATTPLLALMLLSGAMFILWLMVVLAVMIYLLYAWVARFDYFMAGMAVTHEPIGVLLKEIWNMPKWLLQRFQVLLLYRILAGIVITILFIPVQLALAKFEQYLLIPSYIVQVVAMVFLVTTVVGFVRGRDEWAELSEQDPEEKKPAVSTRQWEV